MAEDLPHARSGDASRSDRRPTGLGTAAVALVVGAAGTVLPALGRDGPPRERDLKQALRAAIERNPRGMVLGDREWNPRLEGWPGVGGVDIALFESEADTDPVAAVELKWGSGTLFNTIWDALKLATVVHEHRRPCALMVAGAPGPEWDSLADGPSSSRRHRF